MPELFKLINKEFSEKDSEWQWTYLIQFEFAFNNKKIDEITITDYYQKKHPEITNELILDIFWEKLNGERRDPRKRHSKRDVFVEERTPFKGKKYRLIFWFKDGTNNHLWVRNCHQQDKI